MSEGPAAGKSQPAEEQPQPAAEQSLPGAYPAPEELLAAWAARLGGAFTCERLAERNYVFRVRAPERNYILKEAGRINPQGDVPRKLAAEASVLAYLQAQGVGVAVPEPTDDAQPYHLVDERYYTLSPEVPFAPDENASPERLYRSIGAAIARLHKALGAYPGPIYSWRMDLPPRILDEGASEILKHLEGQEFAAFSAALDNLRGPITERLGGLPAQYIHGDCHGGNIMIVGETVSGFIDLDHLPYGPRLYDLCYLAANDAIFNYLKPGWEAAWFSAILPSLFRGYAQEIEITPAEKDAAPYLMLGVLLIMVGWFFAGGNLAWARGDLQTFFWLYARIPKVRESIE